MEGFIHTDDDVRLRYTEHGSGRPVVFVHGWLGAADQWRPAAQALAGECRAVVYDQRGHGRSEDARSGWTIHRLADDLAHLLERLGAIDAVLVGHSMGCSVIWAYLELFGPARLERLVFVDQAPTMVSDPVWDERTIAHAGAMFTDAELHRLCHSLADPESGEDTVRAIVAGMVTRSAPPGLTERVIAWALRVDGSYAAELLRHHAHQDWRRQIGLIRLPALVVAGRASVVPWTAAEWIAREIPGAQLEIFEPDEGGSQLLALENPARFNELLREFLAGPVTRTQDRLSASSHRHPLNAKEQRHETHSDSPATQGARRKQAPPTPAARGGAVARTRRLARRQRTDHSLSGSGALDRDSGPMAAFRGGVIAMSTATQSLHEGFQNSPPSVEVEATFAWLDRIDAHPLTQEIKRRMSELCPIDAGDRVLDVGCGLGHELARLSERVGRRGRAVGIDANPAMIAEARRRAAEAWFPGQYEVGDAHNLDFPEDTFDLCLTERVLRYLRDPEAAVREMTRVVRPGGSVLAFDFDSDQTIVDATDQSLARRLADVLDAAVPNPWIGRQMYGLFRRVGLADVRVVPHTVVLTGADGFATYRQLNQGTIARAVQDGQISPPEAKTWWGGLEQAANTDRFLSVNLGFIVAGRKA